MEERSRYVAFRFRAYPTRAQETLLQQWQGAQRALWNSAHAQRLERLSRPGYDPRRAKRYLSGFDQHVELTECRRELDWLREVPQMLQQDLLTQLDRAWKRFFARDGGRPRFKRKVRGDWAPLGIAARECKRISRKRVQLPKLGALRVRGHRALVGKPVRVSVTREVDQWFVSVTCEVTEAQPVAPTGEAVGLDLGVANVLADSEGRLVANPRHLARAQKRLARAQRTAARRKPKRGQPASSNYRKATRKLALLHRKVRRQRADMQHVLTHHYANSHGTVVIEDLRVRAMSSSARGTQQQPGARVRQKAGLNKAILDVGWHALRRQLSYKCERSGAKLLVVDPRYSSQQCPSCGVIDKQSRPTQALFVCVACGYRAHADVNAAQNILARGVGRAGATPVPVCGGLAVGRPSMQKEVA
ncbi:MAG TPA: transposase [Polyangiales bacterium]|nr:transposase [Polyangiales bacterium]